MADTQNEEASKKRAQRDGKSKSEEGRWWKLNAIVTYILILALIVLVIVTRCTCKQDDITKGKIDIPPIEKASSQMSVQDEVNEEADKGKFTVFINKNIVMESGSSKANLLIQNEDINENPVIVELYLANAADTAGPTDENLLYRSYLLPTGYKIEEANLDKDLSKGVYECKADFKVTGNGSNETISIATVNVTITVNN